MVGIVIFVHLLSIIFAVTTEQIINVTISTPVGTFIGFKRNVTADGVNVELFKFLGIPYAEPPVGKLRFEKPVQREVLPDPMVVQTHGPECIKMRTPGSVSMPKSEDCLFLNIYAPNTKESDGPLAVMIWIHGGGYVAGSSNRYESDVLAVRGNVIIVTINYRLSVLGFLNVGGGRPSNFGLWDQQLAIEWVHDNIGAFGGDKGRITLFGESAGAGSVIYQGIYPGNKGLFHRIIAESGSASSPGLESLDPISEAKEFAGLVGCDNNKTENMLDCLRSLPGKTISDTLTDVTNNLLRVPTPFNPSVDDHFIKTSATDILNEHLNVGSMERNSFAKFDLMMGTNSGEGALYFNPLFGVEGDMNFFLPNRTLFETKLIPICVKQFLQQNRLKDDKDLLTKFIISAYTSWDDPDNQKRIRANYLDMHTDIGFIVPCLQTMDVHSKISRQNAYMYHFSVVPLSHLMPTPSWAQVANHGDELQYVFGIHMNEMSNIKKIGMFQKWEKELSKNIMIMWSNFAKSGNPNQPRDIAVNWQPFTQANQMYLEIGNTLNTTTNKDNLIEGRAYAWKTLLPAVSKVLSHRSKSCVPVTSNGSRFSVCPLWSVLLMFLIVDYMQQGSVQNC